MNLADVLDITPDQVLLVAPHVVPKTSSGKLQRAQCKALYLEQKLGKWTIPPWLQIVRLGFGMVWRKSVDILTLACRLLYTLYLASLVVLVSPIAYPLIVILPSPAAIRFARALAKGFIALSGWRIHLVNRHYLQTTSPTIFVANHASYIDSLILFALLPAHTRLVGKKELLSVPILRTLIRKLEVLSVDRLDSLQGLEDTKKIATMLRAGHPILIFPEGTFGYVAGLRPFRLGAFKIAAEAHAAICPITLSGTRHILRDHAKLMQPGTVTVMISEPLQATGVEWQDIVHLRDVARTEIAKHCGEMTLDFITTHPVNTVPMEPRHQ